MSPLTRILVDIVEQTALIFLFIGSLGCLVFGTALLLRQDWSLRLSNTMNRWISSRQLLRPLDVEHDTQRFLYQRHPWVGATIVIGALYVLHFLWFRYTPEPFLLVFRRSMRVGALDWLLQSLWWIVLVSNLFALVIGAIMFFRPSLLKGVESWGNRNYSTRKVGKSWEAMQLEPDRLVQSNPRVFGWLIVSGSLYVAVTLGFIVLGRFLH